MYMMYCILHKHGNLYILHFEINDSEKTFTFNLMIIFSKTPFS